jgi:hypothetical protein
LRLAILGSRNPKKWGFGGFTWGKAPRETPKFPPLVGENRLDAIVLSEWQAPAIASDKGDKI